MGVHAALKRESSLVGVLNRVLGLLLEDAPEAAFRALEPDLGGAASDGARELMDRALQLRRQLEQQRRREVELAALYETAGDLSSLRDVEQVLQSIVHRARALLHTDAAYMMLHDEERGDTYMRVTDGITTDAFKHARLDLGAGLGGLVAKSGNPYSTADYFADPRFQHTVDDVVGLEGLIAIQGVPLKLAGRVIGVLMSANRRARPFSQEEVALLISLANHAAIAIENASLFQGMHRALDELTQANAVIRENSTSVERAAALHAKLTTIVLEGGGMNDVAATVAQVMDASLSVFDPRGRLVASAGEPTIVPGEGGGPGAGCPVRAAIREACAQSVVGRQSTRLEVAGLPPVCVTPIVAASDVLGVLVLAREGLDESDVRSLERVALVTALMLLHKRSLAEAEHRMRGELLDDLLSTRLRDVEGVLRRAALLGLELEQPTTVLVARGRNSDLRRLIADEAAAFARAHEGLTGEYAGSTVLLLPGGTSPGDQARSLSARLSSAAGIPVTVGGAASGGGVGDLTAAYRDAARCLDVLLALDRDGEGAAPSDLGIYGLLFSQTGREELERFVTTQIGAVLDYDTQRNSELTRTLLTYFQCDANLARTAAALYVHVNTLYQRLERVTQLLGERWRHGDEALQVHLALKLRQVLSGE